MSLDQTVTDVSGPYQPVSTTMPKPHREVYTITDDRVMRVNRAFTRLFGYTPHEALGRHLRELFVPGESRTEEPREAGVVAVGPPVEVEGVRQRKDSRRVPWR
jgi:PAS domain S-box-containing protein